MISRGQTLMILYLQEAVNLGHGRLAAIRGNNLKGDDAGVHQQQGVKITGGATADCYSQLQIL
jgi:hypothetical protein